MSDYLDTGVAAHVLDLQVISNALTGNGIADGMVPSKAGALETEVTAGTAIVDGTEVQFASTDDQSAVHNGGDTDPRRDVVYVTDVTGDAVLAIAEGDPGTPVHAAGDDSVAFADAPFEFAAPAPPTFADFDGVPVAEVAVPAGATDYTEADHLRELRQTADVFVDTIAAFSELHLPEYDNTNNAPSVPGNVIRITGDGIDSEGVYVWDGSDWTRFGEEITLDDLVIDSDRNWNGYSITNLDTLTVNELQVNDHFHVQGGRGSFSLPDQHTRYADGLADAEVARWSLANDEHLEVTLLEVTHLGGGSDVDFTVSLVDVNANNTLASTSDRTRGSPIATSTSGADIALHVTNATGDPVDATISGQLYRMRD